MRISDWAVYTPDRNYHVFVELQTDEGVSGWGACFSQTPQAVGALEWLKRFVIACIAFGSVSSPGTRTTRWKWLLIRQ